MFCHVQLVDRSRQIGQVWGPLSGHYYLEHQPSHVLRLYEDFDCCRVFHQLAKRADWGVRDGAVGKLHSTSIEN
jgi:hypothetical protein